MQFQTEIRASVPRSRCSECGVKTVAVPWAGKHSRFTLMFEAFSIRVLQASASVSKAAKLLGLSWEAMHRIIERAVERSLARRCIDRIFRVGIDEKSFGKAQDCISIVTDPQNRRVLEVSQGRTIDSCDELWKTFTQQQREAIPLAIEWSWRVTRTALPAL